MNFVEIYRFDFFRIRLSLKTTFKTAAAAKYLKMLMIFFFVLNSKYVCTSFFVGVGIFQVAFTCFFFWTFPNDERELGQEGKHFFREKLYVYEYWAYSDIHSYLYVLPTDKIRLGSGPKKNVCTGFIFYWLIEKNYGTQ